MSATSQTAIFSPGTWQADDGRIAEGPTISTVDAPPARLPWLCRIA
ncbi:hypothetical protein [Streptomyces sp. NPDC003247]